MSLASFIDYNDITEDVINRFNNNIQQLDNGCHIWTASCFENGYGKFKFKGRNIKAHRLLFIFISKIDHTNLVVCHKCKNRKCCAFNHLEWGTNKKNQHDRIRDGTSNHGDKNGNSKLTQNQVNEIRFNFASGNFSQRYLANIYGVSNLTISNIIHFKTWKPILYLNEIIENDN